MNDKHTDSAARKTKRGVTSLLLLAHLLWGTTAVADHEITLQTGRGLKRTRGHWTALSYSRDFPSHANFHDLFFLEGLASWLTRPDAFLGVASVGMEYEPLNLWYARASFGIAGMNRKTERLGGRLQFLTKVSTGVNAGRLRLGVFYTHISSGGLFEPNKGNNYLVVQAGLRF